MTDTTVQTTVTGGLVQGIAGAGTVVIENFAIYNRPIEQAAITDAAGEPIAPCPYPGLAYFGPRDAELFSGRDAAITRLVEDVERQSLTALGGASGSGKSSVVLVGLAPRLHRAGAWRQPFSYRHRARQKPLPGLGASAGAALVVPGAAKRTAPFQTAWGTIYLKRAEAAGARKIFDLTMGQKRKGHAVLFLVELPMIYAFTGTEASSIWYSVVPSYVPLDKEENYISDLEKINRSSADRGSQL